jgi:hypothetical protein
MAKRGKETDIRYSAAGMPSVSLAQTALNLLCSSPKQCLTMSATFWGCAELQTIVSSQSIVDGWNIYALKEVR